MVFFIIRFVNKKFISLSDLNEASLPMYPEEFQEYIKKKCAEQRELLITKWVPECAQIILDLRDYWKHLVPLRDDDPLDEPIRFFSCIASLMSNQLRSMVVDSLEEFTLFFEQYKVLNLKKFTKLIL
jgi:dynein heavy chain, axonemal